MRDLLGDPERASEIEDEGLEDYAERRRIELINPTKRSANMAGSGNGPTKQDLLDEIDQLQQENQDLQDQLDAIADIVAPPDEGGEDDNDETDDDSD